MNSSRSTFFAALIILLAVLLPSAPAHADGSSGAVVDFSEVVSPTRFDRDLRTLEKTPQWQPGDAIKEIPRIRRPPQVTAPETFGRPDPLVGTRDAVATADFVSVEHNFDGQSYSGVVPPDTNGDVGLQYFIQAINSGDGTSFVVYDKSDGTIAAGPVTLDSMGSGKCANGYGDPIVLYDELAQRWLLSEFSRSGNRLCVYISQTSDPVAGGWYNYEFTAEDFPDYPKYAVWHDAYYVGTNESSSAVYALQRDQMLAGAPAANYRSTAPDLGGFGFQMMIPADADYDSPPATADPAVFLRHRDDEGHNTGASDPSVDFIELWEMSVDWTDPTNTTFGKAADIEVADFDSSLCGWTSFNCFPQPGTSTTLDPLREVVMHRAPYRRSGTTATIVGNFVVDVDGQDTGGIRWFELSKADGGAWTLAQEGTFTPDLVNRWIGGVAMDSAGSIALAYNVSDASTYPGLRLTARLAGDPDGTMTQNEITLVDGVTSSSSNRWGDYASMALDPVDGCTFWVTSEYGGLDGVSPRWATWISSFRVGECIPPLFMDGFESGDTTMWSGVIP